MVRISALAQRAEYIWADGLEGSDSKVCAELYVTCDPCCATRVMLQQESCSQCLQWQARVQGPQRSLFHVTVGLYAGPGL